MFTLLGSGKWAPGSESDLSENQLTRWLPWKPYGLGAWEPETGWTRSEPFNSAVTSSPLVTDRANWSWKLLFTGAVLS